MKILLDISGIGSLQFPDGKTKAVAEFRERGQAIQPINLDPEEFEQWCAEHGSALDAYARQRFVAEAIRKIYRFKG